MYFEPKNIYGKCISECWEELQLIGLMFDVNINFLILYIYKIFIKDNIIFY
jgi:hypothetical protein